MREKLKSLPLTELKQIAKENHIKNVSTLRKAQLIDVILERLSPEQAQTPQTQNVQTSDTASSDNELVSASSDLPQFPTQPAAIHFVAYDYIKDVPVEDGRIRPLGVVEEYCTTVYKVQEAFSAVDLPEQNVYRDAIRRSLYD